MKKLNLKKLNLAFIIISFLAVLPGINFIYNVISTWFLWGIPEKWELNIFILSLPLILFFIVLLLNLVKRFSKNRKSTIVTSTALIIAQVFFYAYFTFMGFSNLLWSSPF